MLYSYITRSLKSLWSPIFKGFSIYIYFFESLEFRVTRVTLVTSYIFYNKYNKNIFYKYIFIISTINNLLIN